MSIIPNLCGQSMRWPCSPATAPSRWLRAATRLLPAASLAGVSAALTFGWFGAQAGQIGAGGQGLKTPSLGSGPSELFFEAGAALSDTPDTFVARGRDYAFVIQPGRVEMSLRKGPSRKSSPALSRHELASGQAFETAQVQIEFVDAARNASIRGEGELAGKINYLTGSDPERWRTGVSTYDKVQIDGLYREIDLVYYGNHQKLEYDLTVRPGGNPSNIALRFHGADQLRVDPDGTLVLKVKGQEIRQLKPTLYQVEGTKRVDVPGGYVMADACTVKFSVGKYDPRRALVIDPVLAYSTYFGGNSTDLGLAVKVDSAGDIYLAGQTLSTQFPFTIPSGGLQNNFGGGTYNGDAFVAKLDNTGKKLIYFTYLGGSGEDGGLDLDIDSAGHAFVTGFTQSPNFPIKNAVYPHISGTADPTLGLYNSDGFVAELNTNGSGLVFATYLGGTNSDYADGIAVDPAGNVYVTGLASSTNFPVKNALPGHAQFSGGVYDGFVTKIATGGTSIVYSTFLGGSGLDEGQGIATDSSGFAYITGFTTSSDFPITTNAFQRFLNNSTNYVPDIDGFFTKLSPTGALVYSTYLGGYYNDYAYRVRTDAAGSAYICGSSESIDFPCTVTNVPGLVRPYDPNNVVISYDAFLTKFDSNGRLVYSTIFGGSAMDTALDLAVDLAGDAFLIGGSYSTDLPVTNVFTGFRASNSGGSDVFVTAINSDATAVFYSAYIGGSADDWGYGIAVDAESSAYIVGKTASGNFPTLSPIQSGLNGNSDSFLAKIRLNNPTLTLTLSGDLLSLSWPATASGFVLESSPSLMLPLHWTAVSQPPVLSGGVYSVGVPATNQGTLFRLYHP